MLYIFEGVDLVGKSTLAEMTGIKYDIPVIKKRFDVLKDGQQKEFLNTNTIESIQKFFWLSVFPLRKKYDIIIDRALLSSLVYGTFFNRVYDKGYIYEALADPWVKVFFVFADAQSIKQRKEIRTEKFFGLEEVIRIQEIYFDVVEMLLKDEIKVNVINNSNGLDINANIPNL